MSTALRRTPATRRLLALISALPVTLLAQPVVWDGGGSDANWSTPENWDGDVVPVSDPATELVFTGSVNTAPFADAPAFTLSSLSFDSGAEAFTLSGGELTLSGSINNNSSFSQSIANNLVLSANTSVNATTGSLVFGGTITTPGYLSLSGGAGNSVTFSSGIFGNNTPDATLSLVGDSGFTTILAADNSGLAGLIEVADGNILQVGTGSTTGTLGATSVSLDGTGATLVFNRSDDIVFTQNVAGSGNLEHAGTGTLTLDGTRSYSGYTRVGGNGTLVLTNEHSAGSATDVSLTGSSLLRFGPDYEVTSGYYRFEDSADFELAFGATLAGGTFVYLGPVDENRALSVPANLFGAQTQLELENITADFAQAGIVTGEAGLGLLGATELTVSASGAILTDAAVMLGGQASLHASATNAVSAAAIFAQGDSVIRASAENSISAGYILATDNAAIEIETANALSADSGVVLQGSFDPDAGFTGPTLSLNGHDLTIAALAVAIYPADPEDPEAPVVLGGVRNNGASDATLTLANPDEEYGAAFSDIDGVLSDGSGGGKLHFVASGLVEVTFLQPQTYTGGTRVTNGAVLSYIDCGCTPGALFSASIITVDTDGVLAGNARLGEIIVNDGGVLSPGDDYGENPDTLPTGTITFSGDTTYVFDLYDATGSAEAFDWDYILSNGALNFSPLADDTVTVTVRFLDADLYPGLPLNFDAALPYSWKLASASAGIFNFDTSKFIVNPDYFGAGLTPFNGDWTVTQIGDDLFLNYAPIPEPASCAALIAASLLGAAGLRRRRRPARA